MSSLQFRSRIKPAFNYSDTLNSYGVCCGTTGNNKTIKSFTECFNEGGHFIPVMGGNPDSVSCPDSDTRLGCCCACAFVNSGELSQIPPVDPATGNVANPYLTSGTQDNISRCDCERRGGKWTEGSCPSALSSNSSSADYWKTYCVKGLTTDVRAARSCCHMDFDDNGWPTGIICEDVCTSSDCGDLGNETYPAVYGSSRCSAPLVNGGSITNCMSGFVPSVISTRSTVYEGFTLGACYTLGLSGDSLVYDCAVTPEALCSGYWVEQLDQTNSFCTSTYQPTNPQKVDGKYSPQIMSRTNFDALGLTAGDSFQGGVYIGIFSSPQDSKTSVGYGNIDFGQPTLTKFYADTTGSTYAQWAVIVNETRYQVPFLKENETDISYNTSQWDGYYNTYGDGTSFQGIQTALMNSLRYQDRGGFIDYYLPSIYELFFYSAYLYNNNVEDLGVLLSSSQFNTKYISNGNKSLIGTNYFVYGQSILKDSTMNYQTVLVNTKNIQTAIFFRRIVLT